MLWIYVSVCTGGINGLPGVELYITYLQGGAYMLAVTVPSQSDWLSVYYIAFVTAVPTLSYSDNLYSTVYTSIHRSWVHTCGINVPPSLAMNCSTSLNLQRCPFEKYNQVYNEFTISYIHNTMELIRYKFLLQDS